jgi:hypothetical protein
MLRSLSTAFAAALLLQVACASSIPATVTRRAMTPIDRDASVFVVAERQRPAVVASLERAGIQVVEEFSRMDYALEVRVGSNRLSRECGSIHNVSYVLTGFGQNLLVIKGRGATGTCDPSIFDDMSRELASNMN